MHSTRSRATRPLVIAALLTGTLGAATGVTAFNGGFTPDSGASSSRSDTIQPAAANAKRVPPECNTSWQQYKPRKTFAWQKTTGWFRVNDNVSVQFRSLGGEYFWRLDAKCKRVQGWRAGGGLYRTAAKGPEAYVPRVSDWYTSKEYCGKPPTNKMNVIIGCYRGEFRYSTGR
ncbi:hypothetical protein [Streptomyces sp. NPDC058424]|uniref:hypothetical protein n=1 Tax=Streptomyces sp. NPDC058424 TaxID=3346491 RepID=UPI0036486430